MTAILDEELHSGNKIRCLLYLIEKDQASLQELQACRNQRETRDKSSILCFRKEPNGLLVLRSSLRQDERSVREQILHDISFPVCRAPEQKRPSLPFAFQRSST